tara:strand:+ start:46 stop:966 length:921 start_codon:yes stop_codon:yes gene_type:complete
MLKKIVFMGTPEFAVPSLEVLKNSNYKISAVYTQPASKANRGQKKVESKIELSAKKLLLNIRTPRTLDNEIEYEFIKSIQPDIGIVVAYGQIIPKRFLKLPKFGFINIHASLLPKWRGAAPIQRSIMNLDEETGISIMKIVEELDAGPIMHQDKIKINENIDNQILSKLLSQLGARSLMRAINKIENGKANYKEQNHNEATYAKKISKKEAEINWNEDAKKVLAKINGLNPNPGAWFKYKNERYKVWKAKIGNENGSAGKILDKNFTVACKERSIKILEIQKEGKSRQAIDQFLLGNKIKEGENMF